MDLMIWPVAVVAAYLAGSLNFAIIVTRLVKNEDIRTMGNLNPGAANVGRSIGAGWGAVVLLFDVSKSIVPIVITRRLILDAGDPLWPLVTVTVGAAAVLGHCRPIYFRFRGGGGIATSIGVYLMLAPVESVVALLGAAGLVALLVRNVEHKYGPYTPILFLILGPIVTTLSALFLDLQLFETIRVGGHHWYVPASMLAISLLILALKPGFLAHRIEDLREGRSPAHSDGPG